VPRKKPEGQLDTVFGAAHMTLSEVGEVLGLTRERVRQIEVSALKKLRAALRKAGIDSLNDLL